MQRVADADAALRAGQLNYKACRKRPCKVQSGACIKHALVLFAGRHICSGAVQSDNEVNYLTAWLQTNCKPIAVGGAGQECK